MENYDHKKLLSPLGFTDEGFEPSLEKVVAGDTRVVTLEQFKITVNRCPELIRSTIIALRHKHDKLVSQAAVTRYLTRQGIQVIQKIHSIKSLKEKKKLAYENGDERARIILSGNIYDFGYRISLTNYRITIYAEEWVRAAITELACDIGTPQETIAIITLITGCLTSKTWIPARHLALMKEELIHFVAWVNGLAT